MEVDKKNVKDMSLADIIKKDRTMGKGGDKFGKGKRGGRGGANANNGQRQGGGQNIMKARRTEG